MVPVQIWNLSPSSRFLHVECGLSEMTAFKGSEAADNDINVAAAWWCQDVPGFHRALNPKPY